MSIASTTNKMHLLECHLLCTASPRETWTLVEQRGGAWTVGVWEGVLFQAADVASQSGNGFTAQHRGFAQPCIWEALTKYLLMSF